MASELLIDLPKEHFKPGETIQGSILWSVDKPPDTVELTLGWWTEGRGTKDSEIVFQQAWQTRQLAGKEPFRIDLPHAPYSFSGHLICLKWALELRTKKGKCETTQVICLSPEGKPLELEHIDEGRKQSFSLFKNRSNTVSDR